MDLALLDFGTNLLPRPEQLPDRVHPAAQHGPLFSYYKPSSLVAISFFH